MSNRIRTAVIPAGGRGTRLLPITRIIPKEMLPLVDKPLIQYAVEEALASGIEHIVLVTRGAASAVQSYFEGGGWQASFEGRRSNDSIAPCRHSSPALQISYVPQSAPLGLGHAVLCARKIVGDEPFAVLLSDILIDAEVPCLKQMIDVFDERCGSVVATQTVEGPGISMYGVLAGSQDPGNKRIYNCTGMVEKPKFEQAPSAQAIIGRYLLTPRIFELLEKTRPGAVGEIQLTDAITALLKEEKVFGYTFDGKSFDAGNKMGMLQATVELALKRPDLGPKFSEFLKRIML